MTELIPAIIPQSFDEIKQKIKLLEPFIFRQDGEEPFIRSVQLDIMDGKFVESTTWNNPEELKSFSEPVNFEAHLMVENPEIYVENWLYSGVVRIITHIEATTDPDLLIKLCHDAGIQYGIALNPETSNEKIISKHVKTLLPSYDVFDETRHFEPAPSHHIQLTQISHTRLAISICEDIWNDKDFWKRRLYAFNPLSILLKQKSIYWLSHWLLSDYS